MRKQGLMKYKAQLSIMTLVLFCLTLLPVSAIKVKAEETLKSPVINSDGTVTFNYQGDGTETDVKVKGDFSGWETVDMTKGNNNVWSVTVEGKSGISGYGIVSWSPTTESEEWGDWKADPLNPYRSGGNPALVINPQVVGEKVTLYYLGDGTETRIITKGSFGTNGWDTLYEMEKMKDSNIWSVSLNVSPGTYQYGIVSWSPTTSNEQWGDFKGDPLNPKKDGSNAILTVESNGLKSPIINDDNSVTINAKKDVEKLYLVGSMNNWDNKGIEMTKNADGIFTYTTAPLKPGIHEYQFLPTSGSWDGQFKDPLNPISKGDNSAFYIAGLYKIDGSDDVEIGKTIQLTAKNLLADGKDEDATGVKWSVDNEAATIDETGLLTVKATEIPEGQKNIPVIVSAKLGDVEVSKTVNIVSKVPNYGPKKVVLVGNIQKPISGEEWNPDSNKTRMEMIGQDLYAITANLPKGDYEFKVAVGGNWDESYGVGNYTNPDKVGTDNINISIKEDKEVTFYYSDKTHLIADSTYYKEIYQDAKRPRLAGTIQTAMGESADWKPELSELMLYDHSFNGVYSIDLLNVPKGTYEFKVTIGASWDESYGDGSNNCKIVLPDKGDATITFDSNTKEITSKVSASTEGEFDGVVNGKKLYHNTWDNVYRYPFGAVAQGTPVTLRLHAQKGDLEYARILVRNNQTNKSDLYNMEKVSTITLEDGSEADIWEVTFTPSDYGVYGYKFIAGDGDSTVYYGEDGNEGKVGQAGDKNAPFFQLTVYDKNYETPDWMKEAVVYQIFPDRFNNGDKTNDTAKTNARGDEPIEHPATWDTLPDNPRLFEQGKDDITGPYSGDGIWSNDFFGGDIKGIQDKLDYLQGLGVNTLYLNPISMAASNHKYDATDYKTLDPMFGTEAEFKAFTAELKNRGMHLIVDGVFNHVGDDSIYFDRYGKYNTVGAYEYWSYVYDQMNNNKLSQDAAMKKADKYFVDNGQTFSKEKWHLWFNIKNTKVDVGTTTERYDYQGWWGYDSLPEFKSMTKDEAISLGLAKSSDEFVNKESEWNNKALVDYIYKDEDSVAKQWIDWGADGWRLDVANEVETTFWNDFRKEMKAHNPETLILGEIWDDASKYFVGDQYDSVMNYRIRGALMDYLKTGNSERLNDTLMAVYEDYPQEAFYALMNLMGSHDVARAKYILGGGSDTEQRTEFSKDYNADLGEQRLMLAALFEFGYPGAPTVYYGDEAGVIGSSDPDCRRTYPWGKEDLALQDYYKMLGKARENNKDLFSHGDLETLYSKDNIYAYGRGYNGETAIVITNPTNEDAKVTIDLAKFTGNGTEYVDQLSANYKVTVTGGKVEITVPKMTGRILVNSNKVSLPDSVKGLKGIEGNAEVTLTWDKVDGAASYKIYASSFKGSLYEEVASEVTDTTATIKDLVNGDKKFFAVVTVDKEGNESPLVWSDGLVPHAKINKVENMSEVKVDKVDVSSAIEVSAQALIDGITEIEGVAPGLNGRLLVKYPGDNEFTVFNAKYKGEVGKNDEFTASFIANKPGKYEYKFEFTTRGVNGFVDGKDDIVTVDAKTFTLAVGGDNAPAKSITLSTPEQQSGEVNLKWSVEEAKDIALYEIVRDGKVVARIKDGTATSYRDIDVRNKVEYSYEVIAYSNDGNAVKSNAIKITPDLVMVDVTFKLKAPAYTPLDTKVYIPGQMNGWNSSGWEMTRGGAVTTDWTYTTQILEGETVEYKYVKGGSWDQEALMKYSNPKAAKQSAYGCTTGEGGNEKVVVENQGDGKMVIQNEVLRWKDMPVVIFDPSSGSITKNETITIKGNAMLDPNLTINGEKVQVDENGNFAHETKLELGKNEIKIHIEPTEANKNDPDIFNNNEEALGFATKDLILEITRINKDEEIPVRVTGVTLNKSDETLKVNDTLDLVAKITPEDATNKAVTWTSSDENIAKVDANGKVTAVSAGKAEITVTTVDGGFTAKCIITVKPNEVPPTEIKVTGVSLDKDKATVKVNNSVQLNATVAPQNATNKNVTWSSSNENVAKVDKNGKVTAIAKGNATIIVKTVDGGFVTKFELTVISDEEKPQPPIVVDPETGSTTIDKITDPNGKTEVNVESNKDIVVEILDVEAIKSGTGSVVINQGSNKIELPFSLFESSLLTEGSKVIFTMTSKEDDSLTKGFKAVNKVFEFNLTVVTDDNSVSIHDFADGSATITLSLSDEDLKGLDRSKLTVFYYNETTKKYEALETTVEGNNVTFKTPHFSKFIIAEKTVGENGAVLPNTGGTNTNGIIILGLVFVAAGIYFVFRRKIVVEK